MSTTVAHAPSRSQLVSSETEEMEQTLASLRLTGAPTPLALGSSLEPFARADLTPVIGTEFGRGVQLSELLKAPNADDLVRDIAILVSQRNVVFFRDQTLSIEEQKLLGSKLGELTGKPASSKLHIHPVTQEGTENGDEVCPVSSEGLRQYDAAHADKSAFASKGWHSDVTFEAVPPDYAVLKMHTIPAVGGDTLWASGYEVYDRLSPSFAAYLETLEAVHEGRMYHDMMQSQGKRVRVCERGSPGNVGAHLEAVHPIVRTNPVTGWKSVFVNASHTKRIVGVTKDESDMILNYLYSLVFLNHDLQVRFRWEKNSIAIWDNRSSFHTGTLDIGNEIRIEDRVMSVGEKPYLNPKIQSRRQALD
ncbi:TauD/TfdA family taurine catabolism dioxygenase [Phanerochaete sordida]|uniref:TauD/TfdA family taurine catabolism dioxygenase n=1 Tax=Phanerochaete sordida TaxID=48140 RepID=A0A9P3G9H8_9APHY|nr:TauD/TfdA family taurine catabolism dioxygenase [Phanerochaete sordida]